MGFKTAGVAGERFSANVPTALRPVDEDCGVAVRTRAEKCLRGRGGMTLMDGKISSADMNSLACRYPRWK